ncbi:MAG TPA: hypothetical protein VE890_09630, partial [Thermoguttaceae bacterium]|nr:hypothetical protein [Thermoguttaceae bacterium]
GPSTDVESAAAVSLLDLSGSKKRWDVVLPSGSTAIRELAVSPDGKWGYVVHTVGKVALPLTHMFHGWVTTNALSVIDLAQRKHYATVLLDRLSTGAADPWGIAVSADGTKLWATLAGVHRVSEVDLVDLHDLLAGWVRSPIDSSSMYTPGRSGENPNRRQLLSMDVDELPSFNATSRIDLPGNGPRGLDLSPDGTLLAAAEYFSGDVVLVDTGSKTVVSRIAMGGQPDPDAARRGEQLFHDATITPEGWLSCATCHPEGRTDGLNWDLPNDGTGNPKNAKSLLLAHRTPPAMITGIRADYEVAVRAGFSSILFRRPQPGEDDDVAAYLSSMRPEPSPHLVGGRLSELAERGRTLFESSETGCARCHPAPLFTNLQTRDVGTRHDADLTDRFDTPTLIELWRTGPYLHDGSAVTVAEIFTKFNPKNQHGRTSQLSKEEFDALVAYLLSL